MAKSKRSTTSSSSSSTTAARSFLTSIGPYAGDIIESFIYYGYYVLSAGALDFLFAKTCGNFQSLPDYIKHILISFTGQTVWLNFLAFGYESFPDVTAASYLMGKTKRNITSTFVHILATMFGAILIGLVMSMDCYNTLHQTYPLLAPQFPNYNQGSYNVSLKSLLHFWSMDNILKVFAAEIFFSFIQCFTTFALVHSTKGEGSPMTGLSELKRFVSGTIVYLSRLSFGERATLHLGFTSVCAGYFQNFELLLILGLGNIVGFNIAYFVFKTQMSGGPIQMMLDNFSFTPSFLFSQSKEEDRPPAAGTRSHRQKEATPAPLKRAPSKARRSASPKDEATTATDDAGGQEPPPLRKRTTRSQKS